MTANSLQGRISDRQGVGEKIADSRLHVIIVESFYLCVLLAVAGLYVTGKLKFPPLIVDFPIGVIWFGALGAVLISLTGAVEHRNDWDSSWNSWHYTRPLVGGALAVVSWLIFNAGILAVGSKPPGQPGTGTANPANPTGPTNLLYYLIAFVVGYREQTFRELIKRVADVIIAPKSASSTVAKPTIAEIKPSSGNAAGGYPVVITGSGFAEPVEVRFGNTAAPSAHVDNDGQITATAPPGSPGKTRVTVTTKGGGSAAIDFTYV